MEAISIGTLGSARLLKMDDRVGSLEAGKRADFIVVNGDPLADISILQDKSRLLSVVVDGQTKVSRQAA